jgi:hypothetical protein
MVEINVLLLIELLLLAIVCFFLIRYYKGHMVTWDVSITVYISWVLGFAGILLLPYDLSVAEVLSHISFILLLIFLSYSII